ncbi:MAG TPA: class I SAM-dependent methyltransferase [Actinomycetes bacterium]|nr:class I SAM-dependent methyltransferase [Actinomycetes bacterium]
MTRWSSGQGQEEGLAERYAARFEKLAAAGTDVHGEATFCESLLAPGASILDAGCGTGRVAIRLAERGFDCVGVDVDASMLDAARRRAPGLTWVQADIVDLDLGRTFDLVVAAGNVVPLVADGTESAVVARMAAHVRDGGALVAGFGLDAAHLPPAAAHLGLDDYDAWCAAAGLTRELRFATWQGERYAGGGYAVSVHRRET